MSERKPEDQDSYEKLNKMYAGILKEYQETIARLKAELQEEKGHSKELEAWADSLKADFEKLLDWVNLLKAPPTSGAVIIKARERDAIVLGNRGIETLPLGKLAKGDLEAMKLGQRVFIGSIPAPGRDPGTGEEIQIMVPGVTEVWHGEESPMVRGRVVNIDPGEEFGLEGEDLVVLAFDPHRLLTKKVSRKVVEQFNLKPGTIVDCIAETYEVKRVSKSTEVDRFEVIERPKVSFDDVGGLQEVKQELVKSIINPALNPIDYARYRSVPRRILLHGPPGCGKTMVARALASVLKNCGFYRVNAGEVYHWLLGSSAENLRNIFRIATKKLLEGEFENMIVFMDEIDALAPHRGIHPGASGAEERVVGQLLAILDGFDQLPPNLTVVGATNIPILIDSAVRQRFDKVIRVPAPTDREAVMDIISKYINPVKAPIDRYLMEEPGDGVKAAALLSKQLTDFLFLEEEISTRYGRTITKQDIITGRLISQIVEYAKEKALDDRTIFRISEGTTVGDKLSDLSQIIRISDAERRSSLLRKKYDSADEIGINLDYLTEGFEKIKIERAEEMVSAMFRYHQDDPRLPDARTFS